jgi:hypothetical protein
MKRCPYCAEEIRDAAVKCPWCRSDLGHVDTSPPPADPPPVQPSESDFVASPGPDIADHDGEPHVEFDDGRTTVSDDYLAQGVEPRVDGWASSQSEAEGAATNTGNAAPVDSELVDRPGAEFAELSAPAGSKGRRLRVIVLAGLALIAGAVVLNVLTVDDSGSGRPPETVSPVFGQPDAAQIETAFNSRDPARLEGVFVNPDSESLAELARAAIPPGSELRIDEETFELLSENHAVVEATVTRGTRAFAFTVLLQRGPDGWLVVSTTRPEK